MEEKDRIFLQKLEEELYVKPSKPAFKVLPEKVTVNAEVKDESNKEEK